MENLKEQTKKVLNGDLNPLTFYIELKKLEKELKESIDIIKPLAIDESDKFNGKTFLFNGVTIEKKNAPATWNYENCLAYSQCKDKLSYIQKISQLGGGVDPDTGEEIGKAIKIEGKTTISVKIPK